MTLPFTDHLSTMHQPTYVPSSTVYLLMHFCYGHNVALLTEDVIDAFHDC